MILPNEASRREEPSFSARVLPWVNRLEWAAVMIVGCLAVALHLRFVTNVGGLWRDEANSAALATVPTFSDLWHFLDYDSFPILFFTVLRGWLGIFGAHNDAALRALGFTIGIGVLAALWLNSHAFGSRLPILSLALVGLNPMLIRYGDSNRAYGLGILLILLTLYAFWRLVESPGPPHAKRMAVATLLALLSVHCLYYNAVLLFAIASGAMTVATRRRAWRTIAIVLGIGIFCAISLLPYVPMMRRMRDWTFLVSYPADWPWLWQRVGEVIGSPDPIVVWIWTGLVMLAVIVAAVAAIRSFRSNSADETSTPATKLPDAVAFAAVTLVVGVAGYGSFLNVLNYYTQPWYYVTIAAFAACVVDVVLGAWRTVESDSRLAVTFRSARLGVALLVVTIAVLPAWEELPTRHTDLDLLAARLSPNATEGDLILIPRWECGIPLHRYYCGKAEMITVPPIEDHRFHRYDLVLREMMNPDAVQPVLARIGEVLQSGHRIFLVGTLPFPPADARRPALSPMHRDAAGEWHGVPPNADWNFETGQFLRAHATHATPLPLDLPSGTKVQDYENLELTLIAGWR